jgi:hypothetical protein
MNLLKFITTIFLFAALNCRAQPGSDKAKIYEVVIDRIPQKNLPIINENFSRVFKDEIDRRYTRTLGQESVVDSSSERSISLLCVIPITYSQSVVEFLSSREVNIDPTNLLRQSSEVKTDNLSRYLSTDRTISYKKAPLGFSFFGNLFKKRRVIGLSGILLDDQNNIALVKVHTLGKKQAQLQNQSWIYILRKVETQWTVIGLLNEKR